MPLAPSPILPPSAALAPQSDTVGAPPFVPPYTGPGRAPNPSLAPSASLAPLADTFTVGGVVVPPPPTPVAEVVAVGTRDLSSTARRSAGFSFGCEEYEVWLQTRGGEQQVGLLTGWQSASYGYVRNGTSQATIRVPNIEMADERCCNIIGALRNWQHEVAIRRGEDGEVWVGVLVTRQVQSGTLTLTAYDLSKWLERRVIHRTHVLKGAEALDAYREHWHDGIGVDNSMRLELVTGADTGVKVDVQKNDRGAAPTKADQALGQFSQVAVDTYTIRRTTWAGAPLTSFAIETPLMDEHIVGLPDTDADGSEQANRLWVVGTPRGNQHNLVASATADPLIIDRDGVLEDVVQESTAQTQHETNAVAAQRIAIAADSPNTISGIQLSNSAPFRLADLVPGKLLDVRLARLCTPVIGVYRIQEVNVSVDVGQNNGAEVAKISLQYERPLTDLPVLL